ncbi:molybdopterin-dependent oxidoreductase [Vitiosangium sp. GDMCC 1.1324]|uniref:molybdopterin-dependent oxidoreductase n=1 Tax=Vitiosangium sp. (strain GDMCC 1.1324) TaxID=2138576 RepID=UPI000D34C98B|nr:molybdopterin-dependent oxidoreductase [Vitiosangium sp. GDMCC 1.1324]PTL77370.1 nitrate reductase [Vitiosangium sp. GDMCC 1.1324]
MDRRDFLKGTAMTAATLAASRLAYGQDKAAVEPSIAARNGNGVEWNKAPCRFCGTGCHVQVGVQHGKVVAIAGDQKAPVNKGLLCVKGYHVGLALYGSDRLTTPLLRKGDKQVPISWEEAIDIIARRVLKDPKGFGLYGSGQWTIPEGYAASKFVKAGLGTHHIDANARLCMASAVTGFLATYGVDEPAGCYDDLDACDVLIMWGNNPAEMHPVLFSRVIDRRSRGEKVTLIDIGTRKTRTSGFCDYSFRFKPNSDLAIACGIAHLLMENGTYDKEFVEANCAFRAASTPPTLEGKAISLEEYRELLKPYTPEKVEQLSGVSAKDLRMLADLFGRRELRITSLWCMGPNQHTRGTAMNSLLHGLHLLSGHFGKPGDAPTSLTGQPSACGTVREVGTLSHALPGGRVVAKAEHRAQMEEIWNVPTGRVSDKIGYHTVEMWKRFSTPTDKGGDIHTIWVQVTNPAQSLPNTHKLVDPSRKLADKFLIVSDVYPTATTRIADLVLPSAMWVEKNGMVGNSERRTQQWFKMVQPPGQARDDGWQLQAVAHRLLELGFAGMKDKDGRFLFEVKGKDGKPVPTWDFAHYYDVNVDEHLFEEYRKTTRIKHKDLAPYQEYVKARGLRWPVVQQPDGGWRETRFRFSGFDDPYVKKGRAIQFYHSPSHDDRAQIWFQPYEPPPESPDADFPFWLCTGRVIEHWHTGSVTMRIPQLQRAMPQAYVEMNRADARRLGVENGDWVTVETRRGSLDLPVWLGGRGEPVEGSLFVPFFDERLLINELTLDEHDPFSKQPDYKKCAARVRRRERVAEKQG